MGLATPIAVDPQPLYLKLGIDMDHPQAAEVLPATSPSPEHGAQFASQLPAYAFERNTYLTHSPAELWQRLRAETAFSSLSDSDLWDAVAWIWQQQTTPQALAEGQKLYAANCAACHGETGQGDGVMVQGRPRWDPGKPMTDKMDSHQRHRQPVKAW